MAECLALLALAWSKQRILRLVNGNGAWKQIASVGLAGNSSVTQPVAADPGETCSFKVGAVNTAGTTWGDVEQATTPSLILVNVDHPATGDAYAPVSGSLYRWSLAQANRPRSRPCVPMVPGGVLVSGVGGLREGSANWHVASPTQHACPIFPAIGEPIAACQPGKNWHAAGYASG